MASTIKTLPNDASVTDFINAVTDPVKNNDSMVLLKMYSDITGQQPKMWGTSIIGFGQYHYKSERSKQEGDWPLVGFSPRKQNLTLYFMHGFSNYTDLLDKLGKYKVSGGSCLYIHKLSDIDTDILGQLITLSYQDMKKAYNS